MRKFLGSRLNALRDGVLGSAREAEAFEEGYPTLSFPQDVPGAGSLCPRCLTLLSHVITRFGDGSGCEGDELPHSFSIPASTPACPICKKTRILFDGARAHVSFEESLRRNATEQWKLTWRLSTVEAKTYPQYALPYGCVSVLMTATHRGGYGWGIGGFKIFPDCSKPGEDAGEHGGDGAVRPKRSPGDYPIISSLDPSTDASTSASPQLDFTSTAGSGSLSLVTSWGQECAAKHTQCNHIFGGEGIGTPAKPWFPDRLIRLSTTPDIKSVPVGQEVQLSARIVEKSDLQDFSPDHTGKELQYFSLSHCWGPPPDPSAPLGGRVKDVLTKDKLSAWKKDIDVDDLPLTFQDAIRVCIMLHVDHIWIDSLCIIQDSLEDWQTQSAVMADIYKFAWLNIAALSALSDDEGFINNSRDPKVEFGFRARYSQILGANAAKRNSKGQTCVLLDGQATLVWNAAADLPGASSGNAPLYQRAWVYQERNLARRTLGFTKQGISWACDGFERSEYPGEGSLVEAARLRQTLQSVVDTAYKLVSIKSTASPEQAAIEQQTQIRQLRERFDWRWHSTITAYTLCGLTKQTDKLIALSAVAREYGTSGLTMQKRYLAGMWDIGLLFQMAWITVEGKTTPKRKAVGEEGYMAPSWSWASIEGPVQPRLMFPKPGLIALADLLAADVVLQTEFKYGPVKAGWVRLRGRLNRVKTIGSRGRSLYLTDQTTGEDLWFCSDTVEGRDTSLWRRNIQKVVWVPLIVSHDRTVLSCNCLVLTEVDGCSAGDQFIRPGEKVYRRLGTGNFGRIPSKLREDALLLELGTYPQNDEDAGRLIKGFRRNEENMEEFVLI
ncbi:hypothetical protein JX265_007795 [Neoarthrinium moseri]|uniref:Heterokaryon incompatibility domain-containing protein n=1 Tax=Neoarthrinium moseri TaxID=1658444 RepID=A0A9Q0AKR2_9PEZI|nr:hypothetical protein JX265_007795 [Neoarthrinium moseri]